MPDDIVENEGASEERLLPLLRPKVEEIQAGLSEIDKGEWDRTKQTVARLADAVPGSTLVGGIALRLHLERRGQKVPAMPMMDIDCSVGHEIYDQIRSSMPVVGDDNFQSEASPLETSQVEQLQATFTRKGDETTDGSHEAHNFVAHPETDLALKDTKTGMHVDVFPEDTTQVDTTPLSIDGSIVNAKSPEELFIARVQQVGQILRAESDGPTELPRKVYQYLYLNGGIIDEGKLAKLAKKKGFDGDAIRLVELLHDKLSTGIESGDIVLVDKYH